MSQASFFLKVKHLIVSHNKVTGNDLTDDICECLVFIFDCSSALADDFIGDVYVIVRDSTADVDTVFLYFVNAVVYILVVLNFFVFVDVNVFHTVNVFFDFFRLADSVVGFVYYFEFVDFSCVISF